LKVKVVSQIQSHTRMHITTWRIHSESPDGSTKRTHSTCTV